MGNPLLTWEKARKLNLGVDMNFLKNHLTVSFDYFKERRNNILSNRNSAPMLIGASLPAYNMGEMENSGFEFDINYRNKIRDFNYWGRFNYSLRAIRFSSKMKFQKSMLIRCVQVVV